MSVSQLLGENYLLKGKKQCGKESNEMGFASEIEIEIEIGFGFVTMEGRWKIEWVGSWILYTYMGMWGPRVLCTASL